MIRKYSTSTGIGDIINYRGIFDTFIKQGDLVFWSPSPEIITRSSLIDKELYTSFVYDFITLVTDHPSFNITSEIYQTAHQLEMLKLGFVLQWLDLRYCLTDKNFGLSESDYIVIQTKIKFDNMPIINTMQALSETLDCIIKNYKGKIVILGERIFETKSIPNALDDSMYEILINIIPSEKVIDLTVPKLGFTVPSISKIKEDCSIMSNARANLVFGIGGGLALSASVGNLIAYIPEVASGQFNEAFNFGYFKSPELIGRLCRIYNINELKQELEKQIL